jgi:hypothetical protein
MLDVTQETPSQSAVSFSRWRLSFFFLSLLATYLLGQAGVVPSYRDAGDFIATIPQLGIAHPPGYPLYVLLGRLSLLLCPLANPAYRLHWLSGCCAALAAVIACHVLRKEGVSELVAYFCAALWALSPAVVELARVAEMYTAAALLAVLVLWTTCRRDEASSVPLSFFLTGLAAVMHPTLIFLAPLPLALALRFKNRSVWIAAALLGAAALSLYLFLPIRAFQSPISNWGDPAHWRNFWRVVTRADYGGLRLHPVQSQFDWTPEDIGDQLVYFFKMFGREWSWIGLLLGLWGAYARRKMSLLIAWALLGPGFFVFSNLPLQEATTPAILQPYLLVSGALWIFFAARGLSDLEARWPKIPARIGIFLALLGAGAYGAAGAWSTSQRADFFAYDYGRNILRSLPPGSVLYDPDDPTAFTVRALQVNEGRRRDVITLNFFRTRWGYEWLRKRYPDFLPPTEAPNAQVLQNFFWEYSIKKHPFFVELPQKLEGTPTRAEGLVYAVRPAVSSNTLQIAEQNFERYVARGELRVNNYGDFFTRHLIDYYAAAHTNMGLDEAGAGHPDRAIDRYKAALSIDPDLAAAYNDWGVIEYNRRHYAEASKLYQRAVALEPGNKGFRDNLRLIPVAVQQ